jgi:polar amino acid transport system substrate-binding protein
MKKKLFVTMLLLAVIGIAFAAPIKIVTSPWPPYEFNDNGQLKGTDVDVIREAFSRMGIPVKIEMYPWSRCLKMVQSGEAEGIFTLSKNPKREKFLIYPEEVINYSENVFFYNKKKPFEFDGTVESLKGRLIGTTRNYNYRDDFMKSNLFKRDDADSDMAGIRKIANGRDDLFICDKLVGSSLAKKEGLLSKISYIKTPLSKKKMFLAFRKNNPKNIQLAKNFEKAIKSMKKDGTYKKILDRYLK